MKYRSVCTGIAAETVAWHELGWTPLSFSEIDKFCCALLTQRYPGVPNYGDFTTIQAEGLESTDLLMGGTPCQSFSVAGRRAGLDDPRGNLALEFIRLAQRLRPRWLVWENVQGVLSIDEGRTFEAFLGALAQVGYGFAYRVLDAQFDALAQRRERVFVVGYLGDWRPPAAVLFERESLRRDTAPGRKAGQDSSRIVANCIRGSGPGGPRVGDSRGQDAVVAYGGNNTTGPIDVATACRSKGGTGHGDFESETFIVAPLTSANHYGDQDARESQLVIAHTLRADGFDASEDGTGRGSPLVVETLRSHPRPGSNSLGTICFDAKQSGNDIGELAPTLRAMPHDKSHANGGGGVAVCFNRNSTPEVGEELAFPLRSDQGSGGIQSVNLGSAVRRLTPKEWERLMGFQDDYTLIPYPRLKLAADGPRYKAIGNSISVPTLRWIGRRIQSVDRILAELYTK